MKTLFRILVLCAIVPSCLLAQVGVVQTNSTVGVLFHSRGHWSTSVQYNVDDVVIDSTGQLYYTPTAIVAGHAGPPAAPWALFGPMYNSLSSTPPAGQTMIEPSGYGFDVNTINRVHHVSDVLGLGSDILEKIYNEVLSCPVVTGTVGRRCHIVVDPTLDGSAYAAPKQVILPFGNLSDITIDMPGVAINYAGTGCAFDSQELQVNPADVNVTIRGGTIIGTASGQCGIRILPTNNFNIDGTHIDNFTNGDAVSALGVENLNIYGHASFGNNAYGVRIDGTTCKGGAGGDYSCSDTLTQVNCGTAAGRCTYAGNMVHVHDIAINALQFGIYEQAGNTGAEHIKDVFRDLELNGGVGGILSEASHGMTATDIYFEAMSGHFLILGNGAYTAVSPTVSGNYFTTNAFPSIQVNNAIGATISGNSEIQGATNPYHCFIDVLAAGRVMVSNNEISPDNVNGICSNHVLIPRGGSSLIRQALFTNSTIMNSMADDGSTYQAASLTVANSTGSPGQVVLTNLDATSSTSKPAGITMQGYDSVGTLKQLGSLEYNVTSKDAIGSFVAWNLRNADLVARAGYLDIAHGFYFNSPSNNFISSSDKIVTTDTLLRASLTTTAAATDAVALTGMTSAGHCSLDPTNASAIAGTQAGITTKATNSITVTHPATAGLTYDIVCTSN